eukprot:gnl/TRDRNA2_/TRDRNA2_175487_c9_seq1.p3 gnl/TRDRNA2_/TRDRNA2_175487_c9~~gnl/TRDRNA2_/TRDRNA2_175487_c9_seq1.p3  ORF type:complete len:104 (+),score=21.42 gnl/TRDRNA2_/TRDRNA2_175487_c9_seq1:381-692(+)
MLSRTAGWQIIHFKAQNIASTIWAFSMADLSDNLLLGMLAEMSQLQIADFETPSLVNTAWASAKMGHSGKKLVAAAFARTAKLRMSEIRLTQEIANMAWTFSM